MIIILSLFLFCGICGLNTDQSTGIDVLKTLKEKKISCDLHTFVKSVDDSDDEYDVLIQDLKKYCTNSESTKQYRVICHMILIEFEISCLLSNKSRPFPVKYTTAYTSAQVCSMNKIAYANSWIWKRLTSDERGEIGSTPMQLCPRLAALNDTLRLIRFFYKIAPRIRIADTLNTTPSSNKSPAELSVDKVPSLEETKNASEIKENSESVKRTNEKIKTTNKTQAVIDLKRKQSKLDMNNPKIKTHLREKNDGNNEGIIDPDVEKPNFDVEHNDVNEDRNQKPDTLKNSYGKVAKIANKMKKREGSPLGRAGENPEREQINERPKPKSLDVEAVFKSNDRKELRNWVEGKNDENQLVNGVNGNSNRIHRLKLEDNPPAPRRKLSLKSRLIRYTSNNQDWSNKLVTSLLIFTLFIVVIYLILNNRNKVLGLIIEGCRRNRVFHRRQFGLKRPTRLSQSN